MGDISDWLLASQDPFGMDETDADGEGAPWRQYTAKQPPRCRRCGNTDVRWRQQTGKWVLFSLTPGKEHVCQPSADDFDAAPG